MSYYDPRWDATNGPLDDEDAEELARAERFMEHAEKATLPPTPEQRQLIDECFAPFAVASHDDIPF